MLTVDKDFVATWVCDGCGGTIEPSALRLAARRHPNGTAPVFVVHRTCLSSVVMRMLTDDERAEAHRTGTLPTVELYDAPFTAAIAVSREVTVRTIDGTTAA